jgi:chromosome segregation ATPase
MDREKARGMEPHDRLDLAARKMKQMETTILTHEEILNTVVSNYEALKVRTERLEKQNKELMKQIKRMFEVLDQQDERIDGVEAMRPDLQAIGDKVGYW